MLEAVDRELAKRLVVNVTPTAAQPTGRRIVRTMRNPTTGELVAAVGFPEDFEAPFADLDLSQ